MKAKVKAPNGYHFMVRESDNDFYLMKTNPKGYSKHTSGNYVSSLDISVEVKEQHISDSTTQRTATARSIRSVRNNNSLYSSVRNNRTPSSSNRTPSSSSSSSSNSSGGGY